MSDSKLVLSMEADEFRYLIIDCVKECLKYPPAQEVKENLLTETQAASFLKIPEATLQALINKSQIPIRIKGKRCYFSQQDLSVWNETRIKAGGQNG